MNDQIDISVILQSLGNKVSELIIANAVLEAQLGAARTHAQELQQQLDAKKTIKELRTELDTDEA